MKILGIHILTKKSLKKKIVETQTEMRQITNKQMSNMLYRNHCLGVELMRQRGR